MAEIVRRGGWVVRMGDKSMPPLPPMAGVVDYARSPHKSYRADVVLTASSRLFIGCASGLCHMPMTFGVPTLLANWCSNQLPLFSKNDRYIPKRLRERETKRELSFAEMLDPPTLAAAYSGTRLISRGLEWMDNTPDEIRDAVAEALDPPAPPNEWVATNERLARAAGQRGFSRLVNAFAAKHAKLFGG
jgi:putative glycosyltransferase (TIGR04372 family)